MCYSIVLYSTRLYIFLLKFCYIVLFCTMMLDYAKLYCMGYGVQGLKGSTVQALRTSDSGSDGLGFRVRV